MSFGSEFGCEFAAPRMCVLFNGELQLVHVRMGPSVFPTAFVNMDPPCYLEGVSARAVGGP
jgi:hypothetical protein